MHTPQNRVKSQGSRTQGYTLDPATLAKQHIGCTAASYSTSNMLIDCYEQSLLIDTQQTQILLSLVSHR